MKNPIFIIEKELLQEIVNYLVEKPFREVNELIAKLNSETQAQEREEWEKFLKQKEEAQENE